MLREAWSWLLSNAAKTLCSSFWSSELEVEHSYFPIPSHCRPGVVRYSALRVGVRIMNVTSFAEAAMMRVLGFHTVYSLKSASYKRRKREKRLEWFVWSLFFVLKPRARCQKKKCFRGKNKSSGWAEAHGPILRQGLPVQRRQRRQPSQPSSCAGWHSVSSYVIVAIYSSALEPALPSLSPSPCSGGIC